MRPYRRKRHSSWRTRRGRGFVKEVLEYLEPFVYTTKALWKLDPPFPLTAKIVITAIIWFLLFLPLWYFLVPPLAAFFLFNYFSGRISVDSFLTYLGDYCARSSWPKKIAIPFRFADRVTIAFFLHDYCQLLKCFRAE